MAKVFDDLKGDSIPPFLSGFKSEATKENYAVKLRHFLQFSQMGPDDLVGLTKEYPKKFEALFLTYVDKRKKELVSPSSILMARDALKLLFEMNDISGDLVNWKKLNRTIPIVRHHAADRPPSIGEIRTLILHVGLRLKVVILILVSSGMRVGAFSYLRWKNVIPVEANGYKFARLVVYAGEPEQYDTFITPEAYNALLEYKKYREQHGEVITPLSALISVRTDYKGITSNAVRAMSPKVLCNTIGYFWKQIGREGQSNVVTRYDFKQVHGFRKFFKSESERFMKSIYVEMFMGHSVGVSNSYMKPTIEEQANEYTKGIPALTIMSGGESVTHNELDVAIRREILAFNDFTEDDISHLQKPVEKYSIQEIKELVEQKKNGTNKAGQMIVKRSELRDYIAQNWKFESWLSNTGSPEDEAIISLPRS